jgi:hypothetical protein
MALDNTTSNWLARYTCQWPAHLEASWHAWLLGRTTPVDDSNIPPDSPASALAYTRNLTYVLRAMLDLGICCVTRPIAEAVDLPVIKRLVAAAVAAGKSRNSVRAWLIALERCIAATAPTADRDWLAREIGKIPRASERDAKRERVADTKVLVALGLELCFLARAKPTLDLVLFRRGIMLAVLALCPYRRSVFWAFDWMNAADAGATCYLYKQYGRYWFITPPLQRRRRKGLTRSRRPRRWGGGKFAPRRLDVPDELIEALEYYLTVVRPALRGDNSCTALWVSDEGTRLSSIQIYKDITNITREAFGISLSPQLFRDSYASTTKARDPAGASGAHRVLGHMERIDRAVYTHASDQATIRIGLEIDQLTEQWLAAMDTALGVETRPSGEQL